MILKQQDTPISYAQNHNIVEDELTDEIQDSIAETHCKLFLYDIQSRLSRTAVKAWLIGINSANSRRD